MRDLSEHFTMLNSDVLALIKSFTGITSLDVSDAVRQLKREGICIPNFKMRYLLELCFLIHHKFEKKKWTTKKCKLQRANIRGEVGCQTYFTSLDRNHFLLAFKLMGYDYKYDALTTFSVAGSLLPPLKWCKLLKKKYDQHNKKVPLVKLRFSICEREKCEMIMLRRLF
jgi:hypothetical protein